MTVPKGDYFQRQGDPDAEEKAQGQIAGLLENWRTTMANRSGVMSREDGSDLRGDELRTPELNNSRRSAETQGQPLEFLTVPDQADHAIVAFHNLMNGLDAMMINDARDELLLHLTAEFVMIRALIEAATTALWLLGPQDSDTRVARALRLRHDELIHSLHLAKNYSTFAGTLGGEEYRAQEGFVKAQITDLETVAADAKVPWSTVKKSLTPSAIANEGGAFVPELGGPLTYWYWSTASSLAHGEPSNLRGLSDMKLIGVDHRNRPVAHVEPSAVSIYRHLKVALQLISKAHQLWNDRARGHN